jgi:thymidine kinase
MKEEINLTKPVSIIYGPVGSGKTKALMDEIKKDSNKKKIIIKNSIDKRCDEDHICTHNYLNDPEKFKDERIKATYVTKKLTYLFDNDEFMNDLKSNQIDNIYIDEGQFFQDLINFIEVVSKHKVVYVATLDRDWQKIYFPEIEKCLWSGKFIEHQLLSKCDFCSKLNAEFSYKKNKDVKIDGFLVGGLETYGSICEDCDYNE